MSTVFIAYQLRDELDAVVGNAENRGGFPGPHKCKELGCGVWRELTPHNNFLTTNHRDPRSPITSCSGHTVSHTRGYRRRVKQLIKN